MDARPSWFTNLAARRRLVLTAALGAASAVFAAGACTTLLGNDFTIGAGPGGAAAGGDGGGDTTSNNGGAGGVGGSGDGGGGSGGAGGSTPVAFECGWVFAEHREVVSEQDSPSEAYRELFAVRRGTDSVRVFALRQGSSSSWVDVWTMGTAGQQGPASVVASDLFDAARLGPGATGALFQRNNTPGAELHLLSVADSDLTGTTGNNDTVGNYLNLPNFPTGQFSISALMAPVPQGIDDRTVDVVVSYPDSNGVNGISYTRFDGSAPTWVRISDPSAGWSASDVQPLEAVFAGGATHAFFGNGKVRAFQLDETVTGILAARDVAPPTQTIGTIGTTPYGYTTVLMADFTGGIRILTGAIADTDMRDFTADDLIEAASFATSSELPIQEGFAGWFDDVLLWMGPRSDNGTDMGIYMLDDEGHERALGSLPFTATLPANTTRGGIGNLGAALQGDGFDGERGGTFHVVWVERLENAASGPYDVMYYDQLRCAPE